MTETPRIVEIVELTQFCQFQATPRIDTPFPLPAPDAGQWIVLIGENGCGKTALLRALALALAGSTVGNRLLDDNLPLVRDGGDAARISVRLADATLGVEIRRGARTETIVPTGELAAARPWIVGYGVRRGDARGEPDRSPSWGPVGDLHTLFERPAAPIRAADWLRALDRRVLHAQRQHGSAGMQAATWDAVVGALKALLGLTAIEATDRHVMVTHPTLGRVRLDALSGAHLATAGWLIDLLARWIQRQDELELGAALDVRQMTGIVLLDGIDLHLHPVWQRRIIDDVRRLFPRLSFIVTTHNPLTLHGARPGEIYVMRRDARGGVELHQRDIQPGHDVDRVLGELFGRTRA